VLVGTATLSYSLAEPIASADFSRITDIMLV
jgi:hypothetical protein